MNDIEYDENIDTVNIEIFSRTGTSNYNERRFRCVLCKQPVCIDESYSSNGRKMICWICLHRYFDGKILDAHAWMRGGLQYGD